jgi:hypothetical protein
MLLWRLLRLSRRELRFRKQHAIGPLVADFYCQRPGWSSRSTAPRMIGARMLAADATLT